MIDVALNHLTNQSRACRSVVRALPTTKLIQNIQTQFVTCLQKMGIGRVMRHAHCIHVELLDQTHVVVTDVPAERSSRVGPEGMPIDSFQQYSLTIQIESVTFSHFEGTEAKSLVNGVNNSRLTQQS